MAWNNPLDRNHIGKLLKVLGGGNNVSYSTPVDPSNPEVLANWPRFTFYMNMIRNLNIGLEPPREWSPDCKNDLEIRPERIQELSKLAEQMGSSLFPHASTATLSVEGGNACASGIHLLQQHVRNLKISLFNSTSEEDPVDVRAVLSHVKTTCLGIKKLSVSHPVFNLETYAESLNSCIVALPRLKSLRLIACLIAQSTWNVVQNSLPDLESFQTDALPVRTHLQAIHIPGLCFGQNCPPFLVLAMSPEALFSLCGSGTVARTLTSCTMTCNLNGTENMSELFVALARALPNVSELGLGLYGRTVAIEAATFLPLRRITKLRRLDLQISGIERVDDAGFKALLESCGDLVHLAFIPSEKNIRSSLSFVSLQHIIECCPHITDISIRIDTSIKIAGEIAVKGCWFPSCLGRVDFDHSQPDDPLAIASTLVSFIDPQAVRVPRIISGKSSWPRDLGERRYQRHFGSSFLGEDERVRGWAEVERILQHLYTYRLGFVRRVRELEEENTALRAQVASLVATISAQ